MTHAKPPEPGPKQQPNDPGDDFARRGSAEPNGYWLHDDIGPKTYVPVNPGDGAPLADRFARLLADFPELQDRVTLREEGGVVLLEGEVARADQAAALEAALALLAGGQEVRNRLSITG